MLINFIIKFLTISIFYIYLYNSILSLFGLKKNKNNAFRVKNLTNFLILIPCHNEEEVIYNTLKHAYFSDYNKKLFTLCPILDNCSDNTFLETQRFLKDYPSCNCKPIFVKGGSKPKAINEATNQLKQMDFWDKFDSIVILDADNIISKDALWHFDYYHQVGEKILQCRILSHNDGSFIAKGFTSSFNLITHAFQIARNNIGLSASLSGTGFSIDKQVWEEVGFHHCTTLTEDLEFSIHSIINGFKVKFINNVYVLNQNLDEFKPSIIQRVRWCRGHMQVCIKYTPLLFAEFIKKPRIQLIDSILFLSTPPRTTLYLLANFLAGIYKINCIPLLIIGILLAYNLLYSLYCNEFKIKYFLPHIFYAFCMQFIIVIGAFSFNKTHWSKTTHKKIEDF